MGNQAQSKGAKMTKISIDVANYVLNISDNDIQIDTDKLAARDS